VVWAELGSDGRQIMTAGEDGQLRTWKLDTPFDAELPSMPGAPFASTQLSPDGRWLLLIGAAGAAQLCDLGSPKLVAKAVGGAGTRCGAFSPDGHVLAIASKEDNVELWDVASQYRLAELPVGAGRLNHISFSPNGQLLVTCGADGTARVLPLSGNPASRTLPHGPDLKRAFFSESRQKVYTVGDRSICVWNADSGQARWLAKNATRIDDCRLTADEHSLVVVDYGDASTRNAETGAITKAITGGVKHAALSADGTRLVTSTDNAARVWDIVTGKPVTGGLPHHQGLTCCAFRADGLLVATGSEDKTARVWDARTGEAVSPLLWHTDVVTFVAFCAGGKELVSVSADGVVRRWPLDDSRSTDALLRQARIASGQTVDDAGTLVPVDVKREWNEQIRAATSNSP
jgi:WD40 repeat protein